MDHVARFQITVNVWDQSACQIFTENVWDFRISSNFTDCLPVLEQRRDKAAKAEQQRILADKKHPNHVFIKYPRSYNFTLRSSAKLSVPLSRTIRHSNSFYSWMRLRHERVLEVLELVGENLISVSSPHFATAYVNIGEIRVSTN